MRSTSRWKRALGATAATVALAVALPGSALAFGGESSGADMGAQWTVPTAPMTDTVTKDGKDYKVVTTWAMAWSTSGPDFLGINNSSFYGNGGNGNANVTTTEIGATQTLLGIWASAANEEPDAFNWNSFYNLYAKEQAAAGNDLALSDEACTTDSWDSESGVYGPFKYRPEVIWLCNNLSNTQTAQYVGYINDGKYVADATTDIKSRTEGEGRDAKTVIDSIADPSAESVEKFAVEGDATYDPYVIQPDSSSPYTFVDSAYELANIADKIVSETAGNAGLAQGESLNWRTINKLPRATRYDESAYDCALNIERLARGSVYYTLSKINDPSSGVTKKKVAFVDSVPAAGDNDATHVTVKVYDYIEDINGDGRDSMHGRASWSPLVVDQLGAEGSLAVAGASDHVIVSGRVATGSETSIADPKMTYSKYIASADDLLGCDIIYAARQSYTVQQWKSFLSTATDEAAKARIDSVEIIAGTPYVCNGSNFTMDKMIYGAFAMDCFYPELFPNMENSTFWYNKVYHIKTGMLNSAMTWSFGTATLPSQQSLLAGTYDANATIAKYDAGLAYYQANATTDPVIKRILANTALDGSTSANGEAYAYQNFAPSAYWTSGAKTEAQTWKSSSRAQAITTAQDSYELIAGDAAFNLGAVSNAEGAVLSYTSSDPAVVTVDELGNVTVVGTGTASISIAATATKDFAAGLKDVKIVVKDKDSGTGTGGGSAVATPKAQKITVSSKVSKTYGAKAFSLGAKAEGGAKLSYESSNQKVATVSPAGKVTLKGAGAATITVKAAATSAYKAASATVKLTVAKAAQPLKVTAKTVSLNAGKSAAASKAFKVSKAQGKVTYKKSSGNAKVSVSSAGKVTAKKGLKKGTYKVKVKVTAKGNANYKSGSKTVTVKVKVK